LRVKSISYYRRTKYWVYLKAKKEVPWQPKRYAMKKKQGRR